jgi:hypothetical protein
VKFEKKVVLMAEKLMVVRTLKYISCILQADISDFFKFIVIFGDLIVIVSISNSPFCVQAKIIKLVGLKNGGRLSEINLVTFAGTQNGE